MVKKIISLLTAVTMSLTVMSGAVVTSFATENQTTEQTTAETVHEITAPVADKQTEEADKVSEEKIPEISNESTFDNLIHEVEILLGKDEPAVGKAATTDSITVPSGANYEIESVEWIDRRFGPGVTVFENGHSYYLLFSIKAKSGYKFAPTTKYTIGDGVYYHVNDNSVDSITDYSTWYSFYDEDTIIKRVDVNNVQTMKVGEASATDISVPDGVEYTAEAQWRVWDDESETYKKFSGVFEEGKTYRLDIDVEAEDDYGFRRDKTKVYFDGQEITVKNYDSDDLEIEINYPNKADKVIKRVDVTVEEPVIGTSGNIPPVATVPNDANYKVNETAWVYRSSGNNVGYYGELIESMDYGVHLMMTPEKGYVFAEDLVFVVNGVRVPLTLDDIRPKRIAKAYYFNMTCEHVYDNEADADCNVCGEVREITGIGGDNTGGNAGESGNVNDNTGTGESVGAGENADTNADTSPKTGDSFPIAAALVLLVSGGLAVATAVYKKKQRQ